MASETAVIDALTLLDCTLQNFTSTPEMARAWQAILTPYTDEQVLIGAEIVGRYHVHGFPGPAHIAEVIRGKEVKIPTEPVYAAAYRTERRFIWEEHGDPPPGGYTNEAAREALLPPPETKRLGTTSDTSSGPEGLRALSEILGEESMADALLKEKEK